MLSRYSTCESFSLQRPSSRARSECAPRMKTIQNFADKECKERRYWLTKLVQKRDTATKCVIGMPITLRMREASGASMGSNPLYKKSGRAKL